MKYVFTLVATSIVLSMSVMPTPAYAATVAKCQAQIDALRVQTLQMTFIGQNAAKDQAGLLAKLDNASTKLAARNTPDAIQKLNDFRAKVTQLEEQAEIGDPDAVTLTTCADQGIGCIQSIGTS